MKANKKKKFTSLKQYHEGKLWWAAIILTVLASLQTPYNTGTYSLFFLLIESRKVEWLLPFVLLYILGYLLLFWIDKMKDAAVNRYQAQALTDIKLACVKDAIAGGKDSAEAISFLDNDLKLLMEQYFGNIFQLTGRISIVVFTLCLTLTSNWLFALIYLALGFIPLKLTGYLAQKIGQKTSKYSDSVKQTTSLVKDVIRNKETLINYNRIEQTLQRTKERIFHSETSLAERNNQMAKTNILMNMVYTIVNIIPIAVGIYMGMKGYLSVSAFVAVQYSSGWIVGSLGALAGLLSGIQSTHAICEKVAGFRDWSPIEEENCEDVRTIEFQNVDFAYVPERPILKGFSFKAANGSKVLIQGPSGSGKSTILKMISGELKPTGGRVLLNGRELAHRKIGFVSQSPAMFCDTIRYNMTLGKDFAEDKLHNAIERAGLQEFIAEKGLDHVLEEDGSNISGGQRQRIEIARALLYDCSVLLVDEGTSALDADTAAKIHDTLMKLPKTVIEVAHYIPEDVKAKFDVVLELK